MKDLLIFDREIIYMILSSNIYEFSEHVGI